jgi:hypothetical protein
MTALGEWAERIPDLDISGGGIILNPMEQRATTYLGHIEGDLEPGVYPVELALWTPDEVGGRTYILNRTVDLEIFSLDDGTVLTIVRVYLPIFIIVAVVAAGVAVVFLKLRGRRRLAQVKEEYAGWERKDYQAG